MEKERLFSSSIPKPIIDILGNHDSIKFIINKDNIVSHYPEKHPYPILKKFRLMIIVSNFYEI
jgi:hypothetical protein